MVTAETDETRLAHDLEQANKIPFEIMYREYIQSYNACEMALPLSILPLSPLGPIRGAVIGAATAEGLGGASNSANAIRLAKDLARAEQAAEVGEIIAGAGGRKALEQAEQLAAAYGGKAAEWVKMRSSSYKAADGVRVETHWYQNLRTGMRVEPKPKFNF